MASIATRQDDDVQSLIGGLARKMMAGVVALSVAAVGLPTLSTAAQADGYFGYEYGYRDYYDAPHWRYYEDRPRHHRKPHRAKRRHHHHHHHHRDDDDEAVAAIAGAVIGLAIGAIIAGEANRHDHRANRYRSYATPPQPQYRGSGHRPQVAHQWSVAPEPFTDEWYVYCDQKYRSFDRETGTFQPYNGPRKLCR